MRKLFDVELLQEATDFIDSLSALIRKKIMYNIGKAMFRTDPKLFKKLDDEIWEFRTLYNQQQYRLLAFWDRRQSKETLVLCTHGFVKKSKKNF